MKNKRMIALLVAFALLQLAFPLAPIVYEKSFMKAVVEKGETYILEYDGIANMSRHRLTIDKYKVEFGGDYAGENGLSIGEASYFHNPIIEKKEDGTSIIYPEVTDGKKVTDFNSFPATKIFHFEFEDFSFVRDDFGMKELFELGLYLAYDSYGVESYEQFMGPGDSGGEVLFDIDLGGKIVISVYKGFAFIKEFYIGDELILSRK